MKNDPKGLNIILGGKVVFPEDGSGAYITSDINKPTEFIFIPFTTEDFISYPSAITIKSLEVSTDRELAVPGKDDILVKQHCFITDNLFFTKTDFAWVGDEVSGCWAYYRIS